MKSNFIRPVVTGIPTINNENISKQNKKDATNFDNIFKSILEEVKFSKHAENRIAERKMEVSEEVKGKVSEAISLASQKGIKDSLILFNDMAFVVNIDSRTVVTAIDKNNLGSKVFTNIDGAVYI